MAPLNVKLSPLLFTPIVVALPKVTPPERVLLLPVLVSTKAPNETALLRPEPFNVTLFGRVIADPVTLSSAPLLIVTLVPEAPSALLLSAVNVPWARFIAEGWATFPSLVKPLLLPDSTNVPVSPAGEFTLIVTF